MQYRVIKRCNNLKVSEIGLGCEGLVKMSQKELNSMIDRALALGINFVDLCLPNPDFRDNMGKAAEGRREKICLQGHIGAVWENGQYLRTRDIAKTQKAFDDQLSRLKTDYIDVGMIHYVDGKEDYKEIFEGKFIEYCKELKAAGKIRCIGISSHNPQVARKAVESGLIDVLMFSVNPAYDMQPPSEDCEELWNPDSYKNGADGIDPERKALYELCEREGIAIDVMKAFGGGDMLDKELSPFHIAFNEYQCMDYCLTRPGVASIMAGCHSIGEMEKLVNYYAAPREEKDYSTVLSQVEKFNLKGNCMYCGHCAPCTVGIDVAAVNKYLNLALAQGEVPETVADHYKQLKHHASECIACGNCERNCPFDVSVIEKMKKASEVFGY